MMKWFKDHKAKPDTDHAYPPIIFVHETVVASSEKYLRQTVWGFHHERIVYWAGKKCGDRCVITSVIAPRAKTTKGSFRTSALDNAAMIGFLAEEDLELIAQVHSHPGPYVDHSEGDDEGALMPFEGFFSIVVPYYGRIGMLPLPQCGFHRFENGRFRRLTNQEVYRTFRLVPAFRKMS